MSEWMAGLLNEYASLGSFSEFGGKEKRHLESSKYSGKVYSRGLDDRGTLPGV